MARRLRSAVQLMSDIGSKAFDLQYHSDKDIAEAVAVLRDVNGPMFDWLVSRLSSLAVAAVDPHAANTGTLRQRENTNDDEPERQAVGE